MTTPPRLADFDASAFLRDTWQQHPLLIRNPWAEWANPLSPDELAGLACEDHVESRLIRQLPDDWELEEGPLSEARFAQGDKAPWTLLVQAVDHHVPQVAALLGAFRFVPNWRIEDVMVSYATDGGGVGAHFDQYDVFLIQGLGRRRWQIGGLCDDQTTLRAHDELRLLADFAPTQEWVLEPGDMLYLPPRIAHNGVAVGEDCMTYSIGFRAPSRAELIAGWSGHLIESLSDDDRYADPDPGVPANLGEIAPAALDRLREMVAAALADRAAFARWFGGFTSIPKYPEIDWSPEEPIAAAELTYLRASGGVLTRNPASRFAFVRGAAGEIVLFVDGGSLDCEGLTAALAERLCASAEIAVRAEELAADAAFALVGELLNRGALAISD